MYFCELLWTTCKRRKGQNMLFLLLFLLLVCFLGFYEDVIQKNQMELDTIYASIDVPLVITYQDKADSIQLAYKEAIGLEENELLKDANYISHLACDFYQEDVNGLPSPEGNSEYTFVGDSLSTLGMYESFVGEEFVVKYPFGNGRNFVLLIYDSTGSIRDRQYGIQVEMKKKENVNGDRIISNFDTFQEIAAALHKEIVLDSASYTVANNKEITTLRQELKTHTLFSQSFDYNYIIMDGILNNATSPLIRTIQIMRFLLPIVFALITATSCILTYIMNLSEGRTLQLMSSMGTSKQFMFFLLFTKHALVCLVTSIIGFILISIPYAIIFVGCCLLGSALSAFRLVNLNMARMER